LHAGDQIGAIARLDRALVLAGTTGDVATMCEMRVSLASVWADLGQLETAESLLRHALQEAQTIELHHVTTAALITLGPVLTDSGRLGEARRLTMQALNFARKQGDLRWEGAAQLYLSTISFVAGEHLGSEQRARRAAEIVSAPLRPSALAAIARALLAQAHPAEALEQARAAAAQLAATGHVEKYESLVHLMLAEALDASGAARLIVLRGAGHDFCLGRDMQPPPEGAGVSPLDVMREDTGPMIELFEAFRRLKQPVLGVVRGRAWGIGTVFAGLCDVTIAASDASFRLAELERGIPPCIAMSGLLDRVPAKTLAWLVYSAEILDADAALAAGLISRKLEPAVIESAVAAFSARLLSFRPEAVAAVKQFADFAPRHNAAQAVLYGASVLANVLASTVKTGSAS
jgi:enoyl-CoA hydratase